MPVKRGRISIQEQEFSVDSELDGILTGKAGGTVIFVGSVRGGSPKGRVPYLDFESYGPMARKKLDEIRAAAVKEFGVEAITVVHRTGRIRSGGRIVLIAVSAAHRDAAFKACRYVLEELKKHVPIWKQERGEWTCGEGRAAPGIVKGAGRERPAKRGRGRR
jgi:molybdopterin synthase catalytic subunit